MPPEQENKVEGQEEKKSGSLKLLVLAGMLVFLLIAGGGTAYFVMAASGPQDLETLELQATASQKVGDFWPPSKKNQMGLEVGGNLGGQDSAIHFTATMQFELMYYEDETLRQDAIEEIEALEPWVADVARRKFSSRTESQINNEAEQERVKAEIMQELNKRLRVAKVRDVCVRELFTQ